MDYATEEVLRALPTPIALDGLENVKVRPTPGFVNKYNLVEDGRTAEQMVIDHLRTSGKDVPVKFNCDRGPRGWVVPQIELATVLIEALEEIDEYRNLPVEEQMRMAIADAILDVEYAMQILGRRPRDVRAMSFEDLDPKEAAAYMRAASDSLSSTLMQLGNWTINEKPGDGSRRYPYREREMAVKMRVWATLATIEGTVKHGLKWESIETAPVREWILVKSMVGMPLILRSASDTIVLGDEQELVFSDTDWLTLDGRPVQINAHRAQWMRLIEEPSFDEDGVPRFRRFD